MDDGWVAFVQSVDTRLQKLDEKVDSRFDQLNETIQPLIKWRAKLSGQGAIISAVVGLAAAGIIELVIEMLKTK